MSFAAIVTGGASGIGAAICAAMLEAGYTVISLDRATQPARGARFHAVRVDLAEEAATRAVAGEVCASFAVSHVVHNAGIIRPALLADVVPKDVSDLAGLHLVAPLLLVQAALPGMRAARFGRVILLSSRAALGLATRSAYAATKAGVIGLARTWALELARDGITVNAIAPGPIGGTAMFHDVVPAGSAREVALARGIPVGRLGTPEDVAAAAMFFAGAGAGFVTGQTLFVCGGSSVGTLTV